MAFHALRMHARGIGEHTVEVEQTGAYLLRQTQHRDLAFGGRVRGRFRRVVGRYHSTMLTSAPPAISVSGNALDGAQASVGQGKGQVLGFLTEVGDEGVQSERAGRLLQQDLHQRARLVGEVVPMIDGESRGLDGRTQLVGVARWLRAGWSAQGSG